MQRGSFRWAGPWGHFQQHVVSYLKTRSLPGRAAWQAERVGLVQPWVLLGAGRGTVGPRALTWLSTSMAMSVNMSCSSRMLFSSLMISLWRVSISLRACFEMLESMMI